MAVDEQAMEKAITEVASTIPDEIQLCDPDGNPYEDKDSVINLDDQTKRLLAGIMVATGEDIESVVNSVLATAVERFEDELDTDSET